MINIPNNSRVCFVGDSITANNDYISYVQDYFYKNRNSDGIKFYNCGVSGGSCVSQLTYFDDDTARHNPTHIFIMLGVNDSWRDRLAEPKSAQRYALLKERYELYKENLEKLYDKARSTGAEVILMTPAPYAEFAQMDSPKFNGAYALILGYAEFVKSFAKDKGCQLVDIHGHLTEKLQTEDIYNPDRVHPTRKGQFYIAEAILESMGEKIGEFTEMPEYLEVLRDKVAKLRRIYFSELIIIGNYGLSLDEKCKKVRAYLETPSPAFEIQAKGFLDECQNKEQLYAEIEANAGRLIPSCQNVR